MIVAIVLSAAALCASVIAGAKMVASAVAAPVIERQVNADPQPIEETVDLSLRKVEWDQEPVGGWDAA